MYQFTETPKEPQGSAFKFGLNQKVTLKDVTPETSGNYKSIDFTFKKGDSELRARIFEPKPFGSTEEEKKVSLEKAIKKFTNTVNEIALVFIPEEILKKRLANGTTFEQYVTIISDTIKESKKFKSEQLLDIFLEYQAKLKGDVTFLEYPLFVWGKNITEHIEGNFKRTDKQDVFEWVDENGNIHPLKRTENFKNTTKWYQQRAKKENKQLDLFSTESTETQVVADDDLPFF